MARVLEKKNSLEDTPVNSLSTKKTSEYVHTLERAELTGLLQAGVSSWHGLREISAPFRGPPLSSAEGTTSPESRWLVHWCLQGPQDGGAIGVLTVRSLFRGKPRAWS